MWMVRNIFCCILSLIPALVFALPTQFTTVSEMMEAFGDYYAESNSFAVIKKTPLHIRVSPIIFQDDAASTVKDVTERAMIYGIYRSFIHTPIDIITITVQPVSFDNILIQNPKLTLTKTRQQALADIQYFIDVSKLDELVIDSNQWSEKFKSVYFNDQGGVGLSKFYQYIQK